MKHFYAYAIRRREMEYILRIKLDFNWIAWDGRFPSPTGPKRSARLFKTFDEAEIFQFTKGKKYPWLLSEFKICRIRYWFKKNALMIGKDRTIYIRD